MTASWLANSINHSHNCTRRLLTNATVLPGCRTVCKNKFELFLLSDMEREYAEFVGADLETVGELAEQAQLKGVRFQ